MQKSDVGAIPRASNYPELLPEMPKYCCPIGIFFVFCDASFQKYYEIESAFASIGQAVLSLLKSGAKAVEKAALISVTQFLDNVIEKNNINVCFYSRKILSLHQKHLNLFSLKLT